MKPITVIVPYDDEEGQQEEVHFGFLTSEFHAMFFDSEYYKIVLVEVMPSHDPVVYISPYGWCSLCELDESLDPEEIVKNLIDKLNNMTAYDFLTNVVIHVKEEIGFGKWIIPGLITI